MEPGEVVGTRTVVTASIAGTQFLGTGFKNDWEQDVPGGRDIVFVHLGKFFPVAEIVRAYEEVFGNDSMVVAECWNFNVAAPREDTLPVFIKKTCGLCLSVPKTDAPFEARIQSIFQRMAPLFGREMEFNITRPTIAYEQWHERLVLTEK